KTWKLGFTTGHGQKPRERSVSARQQERVLDEIAQAKRRLGLPASAAVVSCYEAGREGFWLHRCLQGHGITNHVLDSSSMGANRRRRRAKSDGLDPTLTAPGTSERRGEEQLCGISRSYGFWLSIHPLKCLDTWKSEIGLTDQI